MAKKQCNFRLSPDAIMAIKIAAKEHGCSESGVIEMWAYSKTPVRPMVDRVMRQTEPATIQDKRSVLRR